MAQEIEVKLRISNPVAFRRALKRVGAKPHNPRFPRVHEMNLLFDTPDGGLAKHGQLLRIRTETPAAPGKAKRKMAAATRYLLTFKSPPEHLSIGPAANVVEGKHKVREEVETLLADAEPVRRIFEGLGLKGWFRYEKYRTTYQLPRRHAWAKGLLIELDETPIGTFVELEGPAAAIDRAARELGFSARDYITKNYLVLYLDSCKREGVKPTHMVFGQK